MNRHVYRFNANFDKFVFLPVVRGYRFILTQFVRTGLSNIFSILGEPIIIVNSVLQFAPIKTAKSVARLTVNSTVGVAGIRQREQGLREVAVVRLQRRRIGQAAMHLQAVVQAQVLAGCQLHRLVEEKGRAEVRHAQDGEPPGRERRVRRVVEERQAGVATRQWSAEREPTCPLPV